MAVRIIGTGHIFQRSADEVRNRILSEKPDVVCVELDYTRFRMLEESNWDLDAERGKGISIQYIMGLIQRELGKELGISAGSDMKEAVMSAREVGARLMLLDRDIRVTMNHLLAIPFKEKLRLLGGIRGDAELLEGIGSIEDIVEDGNIDMIMRGLKTRTPELYNALVDERDRYMAHRLCAAERQNPDAGIIAVVGAGHKKGVSNYLDEFRSGKAVDMTRIMEHKRTSKPQILLFGVMLAFAYTAMKLYFLVRRW